MTPGKEPCPLCAAPFTTVVEDEFPCILCDDTGEVDSIPDPPADGIYLCGACQRGDTENCSGWCGIKPTFPEVPTKI